MLRTLFLIADPEDLTELLTQSDPLEREDVRGLDEEEVTPPVLSALASLVLGRARSQAEVIGAPLHAGAAAGPSVHALDASFVDALAKRDAGELPALADAWRATPDVSGSGWAEDDVREILGALHALARDAQGAGKGVLLWIAPQSGE